jgi:hypothetical protein
MFERLHAIDEVQSSSATKTSRPRRATHVLGGRRHGLPPAPGDIPAWRARRYTLAAPQ